MLIFCSVLQKYLGGLIVSLSDAHTLQMSSVTLRHVSFELSAHHRFGIILEACLSEDVSPSQSSSTDPPLFDH